MNNEDFKIFIGKKKAWDCIRAALINFSTGKQCILSARGKTISYAVDIAELLINRYMKGARYSEIKISTEEFKNENGTDRSVSSIEIEIKPPK